MMKDNSTIPAKVCDAFKRLNGGKIILLGKRDGAEYYLYQFPEDAETGFPRVIAYRGDRIEQINDFDAIKVVRSFRGED